MKAALQVDLTFDQILDLVRQLPNQEKIKLTKELEKEAIESRLTNLLAVFRTDELSLSLLDKEVEVVRQQLYASRK